MQNWQKCFKWDIKEFPVMGWHLSAKSSTVTNSSTSEWKSEKPWSSHIPRQHGLYGQGSDPTSGPIMPALWMRKPSLSKMVQFVLEPGPESHLEIDKLSIKQILVPKSREMLKKHQGGFHASNCDGVIVLSLLSHPKKTTYWVWNKCFQTLENWWCKTDPCKKGNKWDPAVVVFYLKTYSTPQSRKEESRQSTDLLSWHNTVGGNWSDWNLRDRVWKRSWHFHQIRPMSGGNATSAFRVVDELLQNLGESIFRVRRHLLHDGLMETNKETRLSARTWRR